MTAGSSAARRVRPLLIALFALSAVAASPGAAQDIEERVALCATCHGEDGRPSEADIPIIWGQEFYYLYVQLKDYKSGLRANDIMAPIAAEFSKDEMKALAQYFSEKPWPSIGYRAEDADIAAAQRATNAGQCPQCHLGGYDGDSRVPRLAGQQPAYLERTMLEFKNDVRLNSPAKGSLLGDYDDADIAAMAHYLAGL
ncbi:MAG: c-type cytochrome [Kiloniellales bacterium]|nr:c-type cytochrome [Kiloniellales bacterium]